MQRETPSPCAGAKPREIDWNAVAHGMILRCGLTAEDIYQAKWVLDNLHAEVQRVPRPFDLTARINPVTEMLEAIIGELDAEEEA